MQKITRKYGSFDDLGFTIDLSTYGKTSADVSDIIFSVKKLKTDDDDAIFVKKLSTGGITLTGSATLLSVAVAWGYNEYTNFVVGKKYLAGVFVKFTGDPVFDEHVDMSFDLVISQDFLRE